MKVVEIVGLGPGPFAAMLLSDLGAQVIRVDRADSVAQPVSETTSFDLLARGRPSVGVDLKAPSGKACVLRLLEQSDGLIEGFRPGVMERLGLGPEVCLEANPRLVYGRMTGWGQSGPLASAAGHDINYIALSGALHGIGRAGDKPVPPLNLVGDFGGGGLLLAFGMLCAIYEVARSGRGQVVDAAMVDGAALLMTIFHGMHAAGFHHDERGVNLLDSGAHFYETYETADSKHMAIGAIEPHFYAELLERLGLDAATLPRQMDRAAWPAMKERFASVFKDKTRDEWCRIFDGSDACVTPVLGLRDAPQNAHLQARGTFVEIAGILQAAPAPRFSRSEPGLPTPASRPGQDTDSVLASWGFSTAEVAELRRSRSIA